VTSGLSAAEAAARLPARGEPREPPASRSTATIVRANALPPFNAILLALGLLTLVFGDWRDALFLGIIVTNTGIGIWQELRAKRKLDELAALVAPRATVVRDGEPLLLHVSQVVMGDVSRGRWLELVPPGLGDTRLGVAATWLEGAPAGTDYLARDTGLVHLFPERQVVRTYWLAIHENLRGVARVRAAADFITETVRDAQKEFAQR